MQSYLREIMLNCSCFTLNSMGVDLDFKFLDFHLCLFMVYFSLLSTFNWARKPCHSNVDPVLYQVKKTFLIQLEVLYFVVIVHFYVVLQLWRKGATNNQLCFPERMWKCKKGDFCFNHQLQLHLKLNHCHEVERK